MSKYRIEYKQTMEERFDTDMNDKARALIDAFGDRIAVSGESGGTDFSVEPPASEQTFYVDCDEDTVTEIVSALTAEFDREVLAIPAEA